jgi:hypothetical protein
MASSKCSVPWRNIQGAAKLEVQILTGGIKCQYKPYFFYDKISRNSVFEYKV